jgi:hypothetical protein
MESTLLVSFVQIMLSLGLLQMSMVLHRSLQTMTWLDFHCQFKDFSPKGLFAPHSWLHWLHLAAFILASAYSLSNSMTSIYRCHLMVSHVLPIYVNWMVKNVTCRGQHSEDVKVFPCDFTAVCHDSKPKKSTQQSFFNFQENLNEGRWIPTKSWRRSSVWFDSLERFYRPWKIAYFRPFSNVISIKTLNGLNPIRICILISEVKPYKNHQFWTVWCLNGRDSCMIGLDFYHIIGSSMLCSITQL